MPERYVPEDQAATHWHNPEFFPGLEKQSEQGKTAGNNRRRCLPADQKRFLEQGLLHAIRQLQQLARLRPASRDHHTSRRSAAASMSVRKEIAAAMAIILLLAMVSHAQDAKGIPAKSRPPREPVLVS